MKYQKILIAAVLLVFISCTSEKKAGDSAAPKLVVVISVDQMRYDFFERFEDHFEGGLKRLWEESAVYSNNHHVHAPTVTAAGHAAIATGCYPGKNGINGNSIYDRTTGEDLYCVVDADAAIVGVENGGSLPGRSPKRLLVTTIGDWLKDTSPDSKVFSVARKDRSAVLLGGKKANRAFWFDNLSTKMVSSDYYSDPYPTWADSIVGREAMSDLLQNGWNKRQTESVYADLRPDDFAAEASGFFADYPHTRERIRPGYPDATKDRIMFLFTPMSDKFILDFAMTLLEEEKLGTGDQTDMLMIGCSAADAIGHHFGPESHEVLDYYLYLDAYLADLFSVLDAKIGKENYWLVLTSDHGVDPLPEALQIQGVDARRVLRTDFAAVADSFEVILQDKFGLSKLLFEKLSGGIYLDYQEIDSMGLDRAVVRQAVADQFKTLDYIDDAFTSDELESDVDRPFIQYFRNSYIPVVSPDVSLNKTEYTLIHGATGTSHGTPYTYDTHVPLLFWGGPFAKAKYDRPTETVDIAPTLAALLGCDPEGEIDGKVLNEVVSH